MLNPANIVFRVAAILAAVVSAPAVPSSLAAPLDVVVRGKSVKGPIPAKPSRGERDTVSIVGEGIGETEFRIADEIAVAVASGQEGGPNGEVALRVLPVPGKGGIQAIRDVLTRPNVDFGIAPSILLDKAAATEGLANLRARLAYVAPLYVEELHLLAGSSVRTVADLKGKTVSVGEEGGSTESLARIVLADMGVNVSEANLDPRNAAAAIRDGRVDAAFVVSGKPVETLKALDGSDGLHIVPLPADKVPEGFLPTTFRHEDYPGLVKEGGSVPSLGVQNVLYGYDWPVRSARGEIGQLFLSILLYRLPELQVGGHHPKWREVNVAAELPGWKRLPAMEAWLKGRPKATVPVGEAEFESFLRRTGTKVTGENREALFQDFARWRNSRETRTGR